MSYIALTDEERHTQRQLLENHRKQKTDEIDQSIKRLEGRISLHDEVFHLDIANLSSIVKHYSDITDEIDNMDKIGKLHPDSKKYLKYSTDFMEEYRMKILRLTDAHRKFINDSREKIKELEAIKRDNGNALMSFRLVLL